MVIIGWSPSGSPTAIFEPGVFRNVLSIFITSAFLNLLQGTDNCNSFLFLFQLLIEYLLDTATICLIAATLDIILSLNAWRSLKITQILRYLLKFAVAAVWAVVLPIGYSSSVQNPTGLVRFFSNWAAGWRDQSFYNYAVAIYLIPHILAALLFLLPPLRRTMERSNSRIIVLVMWWAQARITTISNFMSIHS